MIEHATGIDIDQTFQREPMAFGFEFNPRSQRLPDDPTFGTVESRSVARRSTCSARSAGICAVTTRLLMAIPLKS